MKLGAEGITGIIDDRAEKIGRKIRDAETNKIPIMLIIGEKEAASNTMSVRRQSQGDVGSMNFDEFIAYFNKEAGN